MLLIHHFNDTMKVQYRVKQIVGATVPVTCMVLFVCYESEMKFPFEISLKNEA